MKGAIKMGTVKDAIAKNILFYRKKKKMSQKELAERIGVNNSAISNWENGINSIDIETLFKVCKELEISIDTVFGNETVEKVSSNVSLEQQELLTAYEHADLQHKNIARMALGLDYIEAETDVHLKLAGRNGAKYISVDKEKIVEALKKDDDEEKPLPPNFV